MDRIDALGLFLAVAETGGFTQAARREGVSAGQVSKQIAALEERLGVRLFERSTRAVRLTGEGESLIEQARSILAMSDAIESLSDDTSSVPTGRVRMTAPLIYGARIIAPALAQLMSIHPALDIRLALSDRAADLVEEGFDLALRIGLMEDSALKGRKLGAAEIKLVAAPNWAAQNRLTHPDQLTEYGVAIDLNPANPRRWVFERGSDRADVRVSGRFESNSADAVRAMIIGGIGPGLVPEFCVNDDIADGRLIHLLPEWRLPAREIWALWPPGRFMPARVRTVVEHLALAVKACETTRP
jgi:DNA-binding transcriptional LysR family regulator